MTSPSRKIDPATTMRGPARQAVSSASSRSGAIGNRQRRRGRARLFSQRCRLRRPRVRRTRDDQTADGRQQSREHARDILVAHGREHERPWLSALRLQVGRERRGAGRVVRGIEQKLASVGEADGPRGGPAIRGCARPASMARRGTAMPLASASSSRRIATAAFERWWTPARPTVNPSQSRALARTTGAPSRDADLGDGGLRLRIQRPDDHRHARLDDAGLLERDLPQRRPEIQLVIEGDRGDRGGEQSRWSHDVGGVEPSAESDFEHRDVHAGALEELEARPPS